MKKYIMFAAMAAVAAVPAFAQDDANTAKPEYLVLTNANGNRVFTGAVEYGKKAITLTSDSIKVQLKGMTTPKRFHKSEVAKISVANAPVADLFDVVWNADGTAKDLGKWNLTLEKKGPDKLVKVNTDNPYGIMCPTFDNPFAVKEGATAKAGSATAVETVVVGEKVSYYRARYDAIKSDFEADLADGFSAELIVKCTSDLIGEEHDDKNKASGHELKPFSCTQSGGFGFTFRPVANKRCLAFQIKATDAYMYHKSNVRPETNVYYHVIGVFDRTAGVVKLYINGEWIADTPEFTTKYAGVSAPHAWIAIGADPAATTDIEKPNTESTFPGQVVLTRMYSNALTDAEVKLLFEQANALKK